MRFREGQPTYVIAEIGANHNGDIELARKMVRTAKDIGCDSVKFQSWDTRIFSRTVYKDNYFLTDDYRDRDDFTLKGIVEKFALSAEELTALKFYCDELGIGFASTPFERDQIDHLVQIDAPFIKIASMDLNNDHLLKHAAGTGKPIILSTGFGTMAEIEHAIRTIETSGGKEIVVLHCVSMYPPEDAAVNLNNMAMLRSAFGYPVGFSDHTMGTEISLAAIALGAVVLEKHFTLDQSMFGWDHKISATPEDLQAIMRGVSRIHDALGSTRRAPPEDEEQKAAYRRSIVTARAIKKGTVITEEDMTFQRPGTGLEPNTMPALIGMVAIRDIQSDSLIEMKDLEHPSS